MRSPNTTDANQFDRHNQPAFSDPFGPHNDQTEEIHPAVARCFDARVTLITGAGGSIGSELARQIAALSVDRLIILDQHENSIFELMSELENLRGKTIVPIIGNIRDRETVHQIFAQHRPHVVLHAAAYKHVPLMEGNSCEAVLNNITGTHELADAAIEFGCERLIMISTDKAVNPSSVMGATKRAAELLVQRRAHENGPRDHRTSFACVRFGNVIGSRGSVIPIFLRQIAAGGPITITHEEMTRYFMTIPQAVRLVLQASTLATEGELYILNMGDPVKIIDLARSIVRRAGLIPGEHIDIKVIGPRPGEKLHERLWREDSTVTATPFPDVFRVNETPVPTFFPSMLAELEIAARLRRPDAVIQELLCRLPLDYCPEQAEAVSLETMPNGD